MTKGSNTLKQRAERLGTPTDAEIAVINTRNERRI